MKQQLQELFKEKWAQRISLFVAILFFIEVVMIIWKWKNFPPQMPLFYSLPRSYLQLGTPWQIFLIPLFSLVIYLINIFFTLQIGEIIVKKLLMLTSLIIAILFFITFMKIVFLVA